MAYSTSQFRCYQFTSCFGQMVTEALLPIQAVQPSYFKDSFELKTIVDTLEFTPNALLFTADASLMYTNIKTDPTLSSIEEYIRTKVSTMDTTKKEALIEGMKIIFRKICLNLVTPIGVKNREPLWGRPRLLHMLSFFMLFMKKRCYPDGPNTFPSINNSFMMCSEFGSPKTIHCKT